MSTDSPPLAAAKAIGTDVERLICDALPLEAVTHGDAHHDAEVSGLLAPATVDAPFSVVFAGVPLVEHGSHLEIKACKRRTSDGSRSRSGRWNFKGRDDGQHSVLLDRGGYYALAVYDDDGTAAARRVLAVAIAPATVVDSLLADRWLSVDRTEGTMSRLPWSLTSLAPAVEEAGGGPRAE
ncbi:hypothetical protein [Halolamina sediminis]|uniref:hypothetical protein n=1 Tax=Halolamina sediminis TaxID=1480675 RepID=UPI0006B66A09|nr:hypothetical protein [Halolamina sediminis]